MGPAKAKDPQKCDSPDRINDLTNPVIEKQPSLPSKIHAPGEMLGDLPNKSDFDNLLSGSSDVTAEALEDTLDTSELEATFVPDQESNVKSEEEARKSSPFQKISISEQHSVTGDADLEESDLDLDPAEGNREIVNIIGDMLFHQVIAIFRLDLGQDCEDPKCQKISLSSVEKRITKALELLDEATNQQNFQEEDKRYLTKFNLKRVSVCLMYPKIKCGQRK